MYESSYREPPPFERAYHLSRIPPKLVHFGIGSVICIRKELRQIRKCTKINFSVSDLLGPDDAARCASKGLGLINNLILIFFFFSNIIFGRLPACKWTSRVCISFAFEKLITITIYDYNSYLLCITQLPTIRDE